MICFLLLLDFCSSIDYNDLYIGDGGIRTDMMNFSEICIEVEQELYEEVSVLCRNAGTSVEALTVAFFEFCIIPENLPFLKIFLGKEKAASEEAERIACRQVLEGIFQILWHDTGLTQAKVP